MAAAPAASQGITGTVGAPGGRLASTPPTLATFFMSAAHAHLPGLQAVAETKVELIDLGKRQVLATATTDAKGVYVMETPANFVPAARFIVRAGNRLDAFVIGPRVNIDPATDATAKLVLGTARFANVRLSDVLEVLPLVQHLAWEVEPVVTGVAMAEALRAAATKDEEIHNIASSLGAKGEISGTVTDPQKKPLARIGIVVRDADTLVMRALVHTDAQGRYRVRVPPGEYRLAALNERGLDMAASDPGARRITVGASPAKRDFRLGAGGRVTGVVAGGGARLTGIRIKLRKGDSAIELRTQDDGGFRVSLAPGDYVLTAENTTLQPYASLLEPIPVPIQAGSELKVDLELGEGQLMSGVVAAAATVHFREGERQLAVQRANRAGEYRLWLKPGQYVVK